MFQIEPLRPANFEVLYPPGIDLVAFDEWLKSLPGVDNVRHDSYRVNAVIIELSSADAYQDVVGAINRQYNVPEAQRLLSV